MSSSDDEDLQRAIALSLGQLDGAAEDKAMPPAGSASNNTSEAPPMSFADAAANTQQPASTRSINESLGKLDRKQLEAERLARQEARKRQLTASASEPSSQHSEGPSKKARTGVGAASSQASEVIDLTSPPRPPRSSARPTEPHGGRQAGDTAVPTPPASQTQGQKIRNVLQQSLGISLPLQNTRPTQPLSRQTTEPQYLNGAVKRTWAFDCPRENDIKIEEVLQSSDLQSLVLSAFNFNTEWWRSKVNEDTTRQIWIVSPEDDNARAEWSMAPALYNNVEVCFPNLSGGINHGKFLIGAHPKYLRIVITTANWTEHDWGESGLMENTVFLIDLPRLPEGQKTAYEDLTPFGKGLLFYLNSLKLGSVVSGSLLKFDWSQTKKFAFVSSLSGPSTGDVAQRTGLPGLSRAIRELDLQTTTLEVDYATSSLGALSRGFMKQLLTAAQGQEVTATKEKFDNDVRLGDLQKRFRVYFPTADTVRRSRGGTNGGGTITLHRRWYETPSFPKACMHDHRSTRQGLLSHNKLIIGRGHLIQGNSEDDDAPERKSVAWAYIGSHNLTQAAWGSLSNDRSTKTLKVTGRNYECGVIVPVLDENLGHGVEDEEEEEVMPGYEAFKGIVEIPFEIPGERYGDKSPWFFRG